MFTRYCHFFQERSHFYNLVDSSVGARKMFLWQVSNQSIKRKSTGNLENDSESVPKELGKILP
jgi:hypothetical protein